MEFSVVLPQLIAQKALKLKLKPDEFEEKFVRGSGAGGQKINKTSSCVWLKHLPSGMEVKVQKHRVREVNRLAAYKLLILKIEEEKEGRKSQLAQEEFKLRKQKKRRSRRAKNKMIEGKVRRGGLKETRKKVNL